MRALLFVSFLYLAPKPDPQWVQAAYFQERTNRSFLFIYPSSYPESEAQ